MVVESTKLPLPVASINPWLVTAVLIVRVFALGSFAFTTPAAWLVKTRPLKPMTPAPVMVLLTLVNDPLFSWKIYGSLEPP